MDISEEFEHYSFTADKGQSPLRVDKFLMNFIEYATRNKIQQSIDAGKVRVNDKIIKSNYKVKPGDKVAIVFDYPKRDYELIPEDIPINITYEDDDILIVDKEPGIVVHPGHGNYTGTLAHALAFYFKNLPNMGDETRPGIVHRIDKNTSGILVIAKNQDSLNIMGSKFANKDIDRKYIALVWGNIVEDSGIITGHIGRSLKNRKIMSVFTDGSYGKHATTNYTVIQRFGYATLVACKLDTGRTHQIRVHFSHIGHPVFNDVDYGGDRIVKGTSFTKYKQFIQNCFKICSRHALHAKYLAFNHPKSGCRVEFNSELPNDMRTLIEKWDKYSQHQRI